MKLHLNHESDRSSKQEKFVKNNIIEKLYNYKEIKHILFNLFIIYLIVLNGYLSYKTRYIWIFGYDSDIYTHIRERVILASLLDMLYFIINLILIIQFKKVIDKFYKSTNHYCDEQNTNINRKTKCIYIMLAIYTYLQLFIHIRLLSVILNRIIENLLMNTLIWAWILSIISMIFLKMRIMAKEVCKWE